MATPIYGTPATWNTSILGTFKDPNTQLLLEIYNQLYAGGSGGGIIFSMGWLTIAAQNAYTSVGVPGLANVVGRTIVQVTMDSSILSPSLYTWNSGTATFTLDASITVAGSEQIVILYQ